MSRDCNPDVNTSQRLADVQAVERCLIPCWPLRQTALWKVKNAVFEWSRSPSGVRHSSSSGGELLSELPLQVRQELLDAMLKVKPDGREVMRAVKHLLKGGIFAFDLGCLDECHRYDVGQVIRLLSDSGHIVRSIAIRGQWLFDSDNHPLLSDLLHSLVNVEHICLQETSEGAPELSIILKNCSKLRVLEISQPSLCDKETTELVTFCSPAMRSLKVPSSLRGSGLLTVLKIFPNLEELQCSHLDDLLNLLDQKRDKSWWLERTRGLLKVKTSHPIGHNTLERLVAWCPNLTSVSIEIQEHVNLIPLTTLRDLKFLELKNSAILPVSYEDRVLNMLSLIGHKLCHLSLEHFDAIDLTRTASMCKELRSLEIRWFTTLSVSRVPKGLKPFGHLTSLCVRPRTNQHVTKEACQLLLSFCTQLQKLEMYCCHGLDDVLLTQVLKMNPLDQLKVLLLRHGHGVTGTGLKKLVGKSSKIELWDFGSFSSSK